ncbi:hypothetical protein CISIN_1g0390331mg [Citrus sinensis]|uniref:Uncharacterized protein n=1 Tax=Citrus sinensis TaxID=2711 RepID=A0A067DIE0_CITSI|nr:hypothetical protein CISIN_1g0390331mg [Citrus sinensis]
MHKIWRQRSLIVAFVVYKVHLLQIIHGMALKIKGDYLHLRLSLLTYNLNRSVFYLIFLFSCLLHAVLRYCLSITKS